MHLETVLGHFETFTDSVLLHEQRLIELPGEEDCRSICDCVPLLYTDDMIDAGHMKDLTGKLTVASGDKYELQRGNMHLEQVPQLLLGDKMRRCIFFFEYEAVALVLHQESILAKRGCIVLDSMPRKVETHWLLHQTISKFF